MKKIGILTYHTGYNYGASLQAYALMTTINKIVGNCEIINFETENFLSSREMFSRNPKSLKEIIKVLTRLPYKKDLIKRQKLFDAFTENYLIKSKLYRTEAEVITLKGNYAEKTGITFNEYIKLISSLDCVGLLYLVCFISSYRRGDKKGI